MTIPADVARRLITQLDDPSISNLFAQADARFVLEEVGEEPENFPAFDPQLDDRTTMPAYALVALGCSLLVQGERSEGSRALERGADVLSHVYGPRLDRRQGDGFHRLICGMALYAAGHYSRAYVLLRDGEEDTVAAGLIAAFLRKDLKSLLERLNPVILRDADELTDERELVDWAITLAIAQAIALLVEFAYSGDEGLLETCHASIDDGTTIAVASQHPSWWLVLRLLGIMALEAGEASPWIVLRHRFGDGEQESLSRYVRALAFGRRPITEIWRSQRAALDVALGRGQGAVINLRTSAGKTRVAEIAILRTLAEHPTAKVFYVAPFRSLAIEVERTLHATFPLLGYGVSHLYGGSRASALDRQLASEAAITIATPEKLRVLFRAAPELFREAALFVIDEGHLFGPQERFVRNEVFLDHVRAVAATSSARILLLSAVLPNASELAQWIASDSSLVARSSWKPSSERFGLLRWNGRRVRIDWKGEYSSFNPQFVVAEPIDGSRRRRPYPADKREAVAATALRLSTLGPAMIFVARAVSVGPMAEAVLTGIGNSAEAYPWPSDEWNMFDAVCREELGGDAVEYRAARAGVICHSNRLPTQARLALEQLMRSRPARVIIATTTLAQGVNVGISSVIVSSVSMNQDTNIDKRDFWNICGRAGRAFVDGEGKILYAIDETLAGWQVRRDERLAQYYLNPDVDDPVQSGLLRLVETMKELANTANISFERLLEQASESDFSLTGLHADRAAALCDWVDDELLAMNEDPLVNPGRREPELWIERVFAESLAAIQANDHASATREELIGFLKARGRSVTSRVPPHMRKAIVGAGLPLVVAIEAYASSAAFREAADSYIAAARSAAGLEHAVRFFEDWARSHAMSISGDFPTSVELESVRHGWLNATPLSELRARLGHVAESVTRDLYGWQLPWVIHGASQQLRAGELPEQADVLGVVALLLELGVPTEIAARVFLSGVRSRVAATELGGVLTDLAVPAEQVRASLAQPEFIARIRPSVSPTTAVWLDLVVRDLHPVDSARRPSFLSFEIRDPRFIAADVLHARRYSGELFLCTADGRTRTRVEATNELPFDAVANDARYAFERSGTEWNLTVRDPRIAG